MAGKRGVFILVVCTLWPSAFRGLGASPARSRTALAAHAIQSTGTGSEKNAAPPVSFQIIRRLTGPVINSNNPGAIGNKYGFEDGMTVKLGGTYHLIIDEMAGDPESVCMRIAHWTSPDTIHWKRISTLKQTSGKQRSQTGLPYESVWGPVVTYDPIESRWDLFYVAYDTGGAGMGRIWRSVSSAAGIHGIGGPYKDRGIVLQPDAHSQPWEGSQGGDSFFPYLVGNHWFALYGSHHGDSSLWQVGLATAPHLGGPWTRLSGLNPLPIEPIMIENPIVTHIHNLYLAVYDMDVIGPHFQRDSHNVGFTYSRDGIHWARGGRIRVQSSGAGNWCTVMRTPLGLVPEGNNEFTLLYTCRLKREYFAVNMVRVKLQSQSAATGDRRHVYPFMSYGKSRAN